MNKKLVILGIGLIVVVGILWAFSETNNIQPINHTTMSNSYIQKNCDKLLYQNAPWALCYKDGKVVETVRHGNLYEGTATERSDYDKVEIYRTPRGSIVLATFKGKLYFAVRGYCK